MEITIYGITDLGRMRSNNEDQFIIADLMNPAEITIGMEKGLALASKRILLAVCDGMGGALAGEVASRMGVDNLFARLQQEIDRESPQAALRLAAEQANLEIHQRSQTDESCQGMGSTLTAVLINDTSAYIAQVGDSRAYLIRDEELYQITKDQTLAQQMIDSGYPVELVAKSPYRSVVLQALGAKPEIDVAIRPLDLQKSDLLLLCSDGLSGKVEDEEIMSTIQSANSLQAAGRALIALANEHGGDDNITIILIGLDSEKPLAS